MKAKKWNYEKHAYEDYETPEEWQCPIMAAENFDDKINCAACGKEITFGESFTSLEIHTPYGFGYSVCQDCAAEEWKRKMKFEERY